MGSNGGCTVDPRSTGIRACPRCSAEDWTVWTSATGCYITAFAVCESCSALYLSTDDHFGKKDAVAEVVAIVNAGQAPALEEIGL